MNVAVDDNFIYIKNPDYRERVELEQELQATFSKVKGYRLPLNLWSLREVWSCFPEVRIPIVKNTGARLRKEVDRLAELRQAEPIESFIQGLRTYQNADVAYLKQLPCAGVFNEPRTGKTPTIIALLKELNPSKAIVVCPASLVYNWQREFAKWHKDANVKVISGKKDVRVASYRDFQGILIVSKDTLKLDIDQTPHFDVAIVDEAHFLRNYKSSQSKAIFSLKAERRYALTGTPTVKHAADIFGILHFLYPKKYPSYWQFAERYFEVGENYMGHSEVGLARPHRLEELQSIVGLLSVSRKRSEVMQWLPDKQRTPFYCEMSSKQRKLYNDMLQYFVAMDSNNVEVDASSVLAQLTRLRQLCLEPELLSLDAPSAKTDALIEYVTDLGEPVVVMSMFTSYLKLMKARLERLGFKVGMIHGELSNSEKMKQAEKFQRGEIDVLLCNIISAGTGFTLDRAETIIFMDKAWNPADNEQAEDRITPTTQENVHKHHIVSFVCQNTVDERINTLLEQKKSITDLINEGGVAAIKRLLT